MRKLIIIFLPIILAFVMESSDKKIIKNPNWELVASGLDFPEGPAWDETNQTLYASNCYGSWISKIANGKLKRMELESDSAIGKTNGLGITKDGNIIACDYELNVILQITPVGKVTTLVSGYDGRLFNRPNDLTIDKNGNFYFSDPKNYGKDKLDGRLFFYDIKNRKTTLVADSLAFPNGINISPKDGRLYLSESAKNQVLRFDILEDGTLANKSVFIKLPGGDPDGLDFDAEGNLYVAHFGSGTLFIVSPDGVILEQIKTPGKKPTNIEFGGDDLKTLFLTEVETNSIYKVSSTIKGAVN